MRWSSTYFYPPILGKQKHSFVFIMLICFFLIYCHQSMCSVNMMKFSCCKWWWHCFLLSQSKWWHCTAVVQWVEALISLYVRAASHCLWSLSQRYNVTRLVKSVKISVIIAKPVPVSPYGLVQMCGAPRRVICVKFLLHKCPHSRDWVTFSVWYASQKW